MYVPRGRVRFYCVLLHFCNEYDYLIKAIGEKLLVWVVIRASSQISLSIAKHVIVPVIVSSQCIAKNHHAYSKASNSVVAMKAVCVCDESQAGIHDRGKTMLFDLEFVQAAWRPHNN